MTKKEDSTLIERFTVRFPDGMREAVAERAKKNGRSMNSEIIEALASHIFVSSMDGTAADEIANLMKSDSMYSTDDDLKEEVESVLLSAAEAVTIRIEKENAQLKQIIELIRELKVKKPT
ncbi:Arc family DNA-binding protein [Rouxiella sp. WC2420]|uniref:Arc family DNA-binding protein n=1 Tax=Rouxiella sp. WC2420 TaxID=3234145 RepID=A0AB39VKC4_9GAMM